MKFIKKIAQTIVKEGYKCAEEKSKYRAYEPKTIKKK